jgi:hypothetical protein
MPEPEPTYIVLPVQGQNGQPLQFNGAVNVSGNDQLQEQIAQSEVGQKVTEGCCLLTWQHSPNLLSNLRATLLMKQSLRQSSAITKQRSGKRTKKVRYSVEFKLAFRMWSNSIIVVIL